MSHDLTLHHIGYACKKLDQEITHHKVLGYVEESDIFFDPLQKIKGIFLINNGCRIELLEPTSEDSPIYDYLNRGIKMYHQCFETPNLSLAIIYLEEKGARLVSGPSPSIAFNQRNICFLILRTLLLIELVEMQS